MPLSLAQLRGAAEHAAAGKITSGSSLDLIVQQAMDRLANHGDWQWMIRSTAFNLTNGVPYVDLEAAAIASVLSVAGTSSNRYVFQPVTLAELLEMRAEQPTITPSGQGQVWYYAVTAEGTDSLAGVSYRLNLYPTPAASETAAVTVQYLLHLRAASLSTDDTSAPVPDYVVPALLACVRAEAALVALAADPSAPRQAVHDIYERQALLALEQAKSRDGGVQRNLGPMTGRPRAWPVPFAGLDAVVAT